VWERRHVPNGNSPPTHGTLNGRPRRFYRFGIAAEIGKSQSQNGTVKLADMGLKYRASAGFWAADRLLAVGQVRGCLFL
jgi:hypothetical protein